MPEFFEEGNAKPAEYEFRQWADTLSSEFSDLGSAQESEEAVYFQKFAVFTPQSSAGQVQPVSAVKTGSAPADADAMMDSLVPPKIQITCRPRRGRDKYVKQAQKLALAGGAILEAWRRNKDVLQLVAADMVIRRVGVARVLYDRSLWPPYPAQFANTPERGEGEDDETFAGRMAEFDDSREEWELSNRNKWPIIFERRNPRTTAWRETPSGELLVVVEKYQTTALEALQTFRGYKPAREYLQQYHDQPAMPVTVIDVWYGKWRCIYLDEVPVFPDEVDHVLPHGYSCIPYLIAAFRELPFENPAEKYRGGLTNAASLYPLESNVLTMHVAILAWNAWRTWVGWTADGRDFDVFPGQYIPIDRRKQEYLEMLSGDAVPPELLNTAATVDQYVQRNGVAQGPRTSEGTRSAQQLWAIQAMRSIKIERAKAAMSALVSNAIGYALMMVEQNVKDKITLPTEARDKEGNEIGEVSFGPQDIAGYWDGVKANFSQRLDPAVLEQAKALAQLAQNSFMPWRAAVESSGMTDNPQAWEDSMFEEKAERSPLLIDIVTLEKLAEYYGEDHPWVQRAAEKIFAQGGQGGQGGGKGAGGGGQQMNNNMKGGSNGSGDPAQALAAGFAARAHGKGGGRPGGGRTGGMAQGGG